MVRMCIRNRGVAVAAALLSMLLVVAGCGMGSGPTTPRRRAPPSRIVSISPTATEMLFAVGAGDQVVAVDDQSDHPADAPRTALSGYTPNLEAILAHDPDLVVLTDDNNDIVAGLDRVGVEVLKIPAATNLDETYTQIKQVGDATGHAEAADDLVVSMRDEIEQIVRTVPLREVPLTYFHELDDTYYTVTDDTYLGQIYSQLGLRSIATGQNGYPQLSPEFILESDPEVVFLADSQCCGGSRRRRSPRVPAGTSCVRSSTVRSTSSTRTSRAVGVPRVVDLVRDIARIVSGVDGQPSN